MSDNKAKAHGMPLADDNGKDQVRTAFAKDIHPPQEANSVKTTSQTARGWDIPLFEAQMEMKKERIGPRGPETKHATQ